MTQSTERDPGIREKVAEAMAERHRRMTAAAEQFTAAAELMRRADTVSDGEAEDLLPHAVEHAARGVAIISGFHAIERHMVGIGPLDRDFLAGHGQGVRQSADPVAVHPAPDGQVPEGCDRAVLLLPVYRAEDPADPAHPVGSGEPAERGGKLGYILPGGVSDQGAFHAFDSFYTAPFREALCASDWVRADMIWEQSTLLFRGMLANAVLDVMRLSNEVCEFMWARGVPLRVRSDTQAMAFWSRLFMADEGGGESDIQRARQAQRQLVLDTAGTRWWGLYTQ